MADSPKRSSIMDDAGPQSLFVVVYYDDMDISILQLEAQVNNHEYAAHLPPEQIKKTRENQKEYVARFREPQRSPLRWLFSPPRSTEDLYMVPDWGRAKYKFSKPLDSCDPLHGYKFNFKTGKCESITPPRASKFDGHVVNQGGHIYFMAHPNWYYVTPPPVFERFDPATNLWKDLKPLPAHARQFCGSTSIVATAVWDDTILYILSVRKICAYNVTEDKWYPVHVEDDEDDEDNRCYSVVGEAVVLENTIYALTERSLDSVLALSIEREEINGDLVFKCSLRWEILVPGMEQIDFEEMNAYWWNRHLVHLGKDNFCLVQSCNLFGSNSNQPIQLTSIKLKGGKSMTVTNICVYEVEIQRDNQFEVRLCFSLPKCKTTALKEGKRFVFNLDPFKGFASKQEDKTDFNPEPVQGASKQEDKTDFNPEPVQGEVIGNPSAFEQGSVIQSNQSRDPADTTLEVQEDVPKKSYASVVAQSNVASKASTISALTGHPSHGYAKPSFAPKASTLGDGAASETSNTDEGGHSIYVRNLPPDASIRQLGKEFLKFGPIKRRVIQVEINNMGKCCAFVEFESATSKQNAIKASPIIIEGCRAVIEGKEKKGPLSRTSGSSSFGKNKFKNHDEVSRYKTTSGGHNGEDGGYQPRRPKGVRK